MHTKNAKYILSLNTMNKKLSKVILLFVTIHFSAFAQPAIPEVGYRWVINETLSDEFNGSQLDLDKWFNDNPKRWQGRAPGLFRAEAVSLKDGNMQMTADILDKPQGRWTHQGGHVYSKGMVKPGSYIECSMKANKTFMSSTFWLNNYTDESTGCQSRVTELDVQECIGYPFDHEKTTQMGSNTHSRSIPENCTQHEPGSVGNHCETPGKVYDHFFTYGVWWKGPRELLFYLNGEYKYTITPKADFDIDTHIKLVVETYNWSKVPEDGGMTGSFEDRTTYYDWVRTYTYVPVDEQSTASVSYSDHIFKEEVGFSKTPSTLSTSNLSFEVNYKSNSDKLIELRITNWLGFVVAKTQKIAYAGYGNMSISTDHKLKKGKYKVRVAMFDKSSKKKIKSGKYRFKVTN